MPLAEQSVFDQLELLTSAALENRPMQLAVKGREWLKHLLVHPEQTVQFKAWVRHAKYDQADTSDFANQPFLVRINDPRGQKAFAWYMWSG